MKRKSVTFFVPEPMLEQVDTIVEQTGLSRSIILNMAVEAGLERVRLSMYSIHPPRPLPAAPIVA